MNSRVRLLGVLAGLALAGCRSDPLGSLDGVPKTMVLNLSEIALDNGSSRTVTASVVDARAVPLAEPVTFESRDPGVVTAVPDPTYQPVPATSARAVVQAVGLGVTYVVATAAGVKDSLLVVTFPVIFDGSLSGTTVAGGTELTIASTPTLKFDVATVAVRFLGFGAAPIISATTDTVKVLAPFGATPGPLTIHGLTLTYLPGVTGTLSTASSVTVTGDWVLSSTTPTGGSTLAVASTAILKFSDSTEVVHPSFGALPVISRTPDTIKVLSAYTSGQLTITNVNVTLAPGLVVSLGTVAVVQPTGDAWAGDDNWQTAPNITSLLPASGASSQILLTAGPANAAVCPEAALGFGSSGPCMMFRFTLAAPTTYNFSTDWEGGATSPDIDVYACSDSTVANFGSACFEDGGAGATSSKPQATGAFTFPAGDHWFVVEIFGGGTTKNIVTTISRP